LAVGELIAHGQLTHHRGSGTGSYCDTHGRNAVEYLGWCSNIQASQMLLQGFEGSGAGFSYNEWCFSQLLQADPALPRSPVVVRGNHHEKFIFLDNVSIKLHWYMWRFDETYMEMPMPNL